MCLVRLDGTSLRRVHLDREGLWRMAEAHWQVDAAVVRALKGRCEDGTAVFPQIPPALCGGGVPPMDTPLVASFDDDGTMIWWIDAGHEVGQALMRLPPPPLPAPTPGTVPR